MIKSRYSVNHFGNHLDSNWDNEPKNLSRVSSKKRNNLGFIGASSTNNESCQNLIETVSAENCSNENVSEENTDEETNSTSCCCTCFTNMFRYMKRKLLGKEDQPPAKVTKPNDTEPLQEPVIENQPTLQTLDVNLQASTSKKIKRNKARNKQNNKKYSNKTLIPPDEVIADPSLYKYWKKRYSLFSKYDEGIRLDAESWYSVTPEKISKHLANRCRCDVIVDGFCGAGGNTIQFAFTCERVIAIDIDPEKIKLAKHNATIYNVEDRIEFICADFFIVAPYLVADVIFLSPPWGGPEYIKSTNYGLEHLEPHGGKYLFEVARSVTPHIAYYLPRNINLEEVKKLCDPGSRVEIENNYLNNRVVALTAYYGELAYEEDWEGDADVEEYVKNDD